MWPQIQLLRPPHSHTSMYLEGHSPRTMSLIHNYNAILRQQLSRPSSNESWVWPYNINSEELLEQKSSNGAIEEKLVLQQCIIDKFLKASHSACCCDSVPEILDINSRASIDVIRGWCVRGKIVQSHRGLFTQALSYNTWVSFTCEHHIKTGKIIIAFLNCCCFFGGQKTSIVKDRSSVILMLWHHRWPQPVGDR